MSPEGPGACPTCQGTLEPRTLECRDCGTRVELPRPGNEFAALDGEMLHVLRIFVLCEGRIRDMEAALGVSYPTVKGRLAKLRQALGLTGETPAGKAAEGDASPSASDPSRADPDPGIAATILAQLESGAIGYEEALERIRALRARG